jgi:hypothetical protein
MLVGQQLYTPSWGRHRRFDDALRGVLDWVDAEQVRKPAFCRWVTDTLAKPCGPVHVLWAARWAGCGFPQVALPHKLAASLLSTRIDREAAHLVAQPWPAYRILVPDGLVQVPDKLFPGTLMSVDFLSVFDAGTFLHITASSRTSEYVFSVGHRTLALGLVASDDEAEELSRPTPEGMRVDEPHARALQLLWRLLIGVALEMSDPARVVAPRSLGRSSASNGPRALPVALTYVLQREVVIDCRPFVEEYLSGVRRASPSVQVLVRGHWKRQVVGSGRTHRKWIHLEPYWRGPEDAPAAIRAHRLKV